MGITESWLDNTFTDDEIYIDGLCTLRNDRKREGGGVCTFIRNDIAFRSRVDLAHESLEATWFELLLPKSKPIVIGTVYRPPDHNNFVEHLEEVQLLYKFNKDRSKKDLYVEYKKNSEAKLNGKFKNAKSEYLLNELEANKNNSKEYILDHIYLNVLKW